MSFCSRLFDELEEIEPGLFHLLRGHDARRELEQIMNAKNTITVNADTVADVYEMWIGDEWHHKLTEDIKVIVVVTLVQELAK